MIMGMNKLTPLHCLLGLTILFVTAYSSMKWLQENVHFYLDAFPSLKVYYDVAITDDKRLVILEDDLNLDEFQDGKHKGDMRSPTQYFGILVSSESNADIPDVSHTHGLSVTTKKEKVKHVEEDLLLEEAKACMRKAIQFADSGNRKLAYKLFKHALALNPKFTEALNEFGEFLEGENVIQADLLYQRALSCDPSHSTALQNRQRTAPVVAEHDKKVFSEIDAMKQELYKYSAHHPTLRSAMKEFYYQHIYHTIALEGNTLTLEQIRTIIDHRTAVAGKSIAEHSEVIGITEALNFMNNTLLLKIGNITVTDIKNIHKRVLGYVDPIAAGVFRTNQVFVGGHIPPHPNDVEIYMEQFEEWLNSPEVVDLHPVEYAAIAHYRLVYIHPFVDGNGRTARLLMNYILMKNGFPPVSIEVKDRWEYYECLIAANDGDIRPFVRFIAKCTCKTLEDYLFAAELPFIYMQDQQGKSSLPFQLNISLNKQSPTWKPENVEDDGS